MELTAVDIELFRRVLNSAAALLVLLGRLGRPAGIAELSRILQIHRQTVHKRLLALRAAGLATRSESPPGYLLSENGRRLLASAPSPVSGENLTMAAAGRQPEWVKLSPCADVFSPTGANFSPGMVNFSPGMVNFLLFLVKNTAITTITINIQKEVVEVIAAGAKDSRPGGEMRENFTIPDENPMPPRENFTSAGQDLDRLRQHVQPGGPALAGPPGEPPAAAPGQDTAGPAIWAALMGAGITPNRRTLRLAALPHVTPAYVTAHYLALQQSGKAHETGLLVTILESGAQAPPLNDNRHLQGCNCAECQRLKYARWIPCSTCGGYGCDCQPDEGEDGDSASAYGEGAGAGMSAAQAGAVARSNLPTG